MAEDDLGPNDKYNALNKKYEQLKRDYERLKLKRGRKGDIPPTFMTNTERFDFEVLLVKSSDENWVNLIFTEKLQAKPYRRIFRELTIDDFDALAELIKDNRLRIQHHLSGVDCAS